MKRLFKSFIVILFAANLAGCGMLMNNDEDENSQQQEPHSSDSDLSENSDMESSEQNSSEPSYLGEGKRIVSLMPSNTETIAELGLSGDIVGISTVDTYPEKLVEDEGIDKIDAYEFDQEQLLELEPTHILSHESTKEMHEDALSRVGEATGAEVLYVEEPETLDGLYQTIEDIAGFLDASHEAAAVNEGLRESIASTADEYDTSQEPSEVFVQIAPLPDLFAAGSDTFIDDALSVVNADNAFGDLAGYGQVSREEVVERDPDYVVGLIDGYDSEMLREEISNITLSENQTISNPDNQCYINPDLLTRPGPRIDEGIEQLAECFHE